MSAPKTKLDRDRQSPGWGLRPSYSHAPKASNPHKGDGNAAVGETSRGKSDADATVAWAGTGTGSRLLGAGGVVGA
eukprot:scaffold53588_cov30-Tisochrysis_lutea.AAC.1